MGDFGGRDGGMQLEEVTGQRQFQRPDHGCMDTAGHRVGRHGPLNWRGVDH